VFANEGEKNIFWIAAQAMKYTIADGYNYTTVRGGKARGRLIGGNLTVFTSIIGSPFMYDKFENTILFLEGTSHS
jgi:muramoyltetrapeptide carboxypeptidase